MAAWRPGGEQPEEDRPGRTWPEDERPEHARRALPHAPDPAEAFVHAFAAWAADHRTGEAAASRSRERWLRQQVAESATLAGTLVDLAEQGATATLALGSHQITGRLAGVGEDGCVVADRAGGVIVVALVHLVAVQIAGRRRGAGGEATGDRAPAGAWTVVDALGALAAERSPVRLGVTNGDTVRGDLVSIGEDVLTVRTGSDTWTHVALATVETCAPA